jgi:hypothetical protein
MYIEMLESNEFVELRDFYQEGGSNIFIDNPPSLEYLTSNKKNR